MEGLTLQELKKRYEKLNKKKGYRGWYESQVKVNPNAGNVPLNNAIFNMAMGSAKSVDMTQVNTDNFIGDAPSVPVAGAAPDGGIGMVGVTESLQEDKENKIELALQILGEVEELQFRNIGNDKTLTIKLNPKSPNYYVLFNYDENGNIMNLIKYSSLDNAIYWASQYDMMFDKKEKRFIEL